LGDVTVKTGILTIGERTIGVGLTGGAAQAIWPRKRTAASTQIEFWLRRDGSLLKIAAH
jgi:hypothetical protein